MATTQDYNLSVDDFTAEKWSALTSWLSQEVPRKGRLSDDELTIRPLESRSPTPVGSPKVSELCLFGERVGLIFFCF